jgi:sugar O-acyltransferase (sialic acid O-acetyltransferase NeuD family)
MTDDTLPPLIVFGAGGHGAVVAELAQACGRRVLGFAELDRARLGERVLGWAVAWHQDELLAMDALPEGAQAALGVGFNGPRARLAALLEGRLAGPLVHPRAYLSPSASLGPGSVVFALAAVQSRARLGAGVIVNTGAVVEHDCDVADFAHVAPNATLCGSVTVGARALVGAGAVAPPGLTVPADALVKAGSRWRQAR